MREFSFELLDHARQALAWPFLVSRLQFRERLLERTALLHDLFEVIDHVCGFPLARVVIAARVVAGGRAFAESACSGNCRPNVASRAAVPGCDSPPQRGPRAGQNPGVLIAGKVRR